MATKSLPAKRLRSARNLTLNPAGVDRLVELGRSRPVPETNLSRLVDEAIADFVGRQGRKENPKK